MAHDRLAEAIRRSAHTIAGDKDLDYLLELIGDASTVLLGEATHGSEEFYALRAAITRRLILEKGFDAMAVEADWPDALRLSRYVCNGNSADRTAREALGDFQRFPRWMWRNTETVKLFEWLHEHNAMRNGKPVGFFGLDLYSLRSSMDAVIRYLSRVDPQAARQARARYGCFDHLAEDPQRYGYQTTFGMKKDCEEEVIRQLLAMTEQASRLVREDSPQDSDEFFYAQQNARVARNAEAYYRAMFAGRDKSWNLRDTHMADTLDALREHLSKRNGGAGHPAKIVVWAHNSHIGDARATEMGEHGQINLGQLVRERGKPGETFLLGFTTHCGTVTAASEWDGPAEFKKIRPSTEGTIEYLLHSTGLRRFLLPLCQADMLQELRRGHYLERAIGVLYLPASERLSHYFHADVTHQFDAILHDDETHALPPLDARSHEAPDAIPETYPTGI